MKGLVVEKTEAGRRAAMQDGLIKPVAGEGEVLVEVKSASVNPFDLETVEGRFDPYYENTRSTSRFLPGLEFSGIVC